MKKAFSLFLLFLSLRAVGQNTTVSSTMTDTDGTVWAGAFWKIDFRPNPSTPNESSYRLLNGQPLSTAVTHQTGSLNASGAFTMVIYDSTLVAPSGSGWTLTLCSLTSAACGVYQFTSAGSTMNLSSRLTTAIPAPRFAPNAGAYGYADVEVQTSINQGSTYWNVISSTQRLWNGTTWIVSAGTNYPGVASDGNGGLTMTGGVATSTSPMVDIRTFGAVIDGATDITSALTSAIQKCPTTAGGASGTSCKILLPCTAAGCYLGNASNLPASGAVNVNLVLQGQLVLGSTFVQQNGMTIQGDSGGGGAQYQWGNTPASMFAPNVRGTLGTAISSTNAPVTITPTFTAGTIANLPLYSAITIAGTTTCTATAARASNISTLSFSSYCRIPAGAITTITGCADTTYNGTGVVVRNADYPAQTATYVNSGTNGSTTGCSVTGFNDDTFESVRIYCSNGVAASGYSCAAGQITVVPAKTHAATELWGEVAFAPLGNTFGFHKMDSINVNHCVGACLFLEHIGVFSYTNDGFQASGNLTSTAAEIYSSFTGIFDNDVFQGLYTFGCGTNCGQPSNPVSFRCTWLVGTLDTSGDGTCGGLVYVNNSTIIGEIKADTNGLTTVSGHPTSLALPTFTNIISEQPRQYVVVEDTRNTGGAAGYVTLNNVFPQDNTALQAYVGCTDAPCNRGTAIINGFTNINTSFAVNQYWQGPVKVDHAELQTWPYGRYAPVGIFDGNGVIRAETENAGWNMAPSLIPYPTLNVPQNPASWTTFGGATVNLNIPAPDGTTNAGEVVQGAGNGLVYSQFAFTTNPGDVFLFGGWESPGVGETVVGNAYYATGYRLSTAGTDTFQPAGASAIAGSTWSLNMGNGPWHPVVGIAIIKTGQATNHNIQLQMLAGNGTGVGNRFFQPFMIYIPASANIPMSTIEMWRQNLLHGDVPPNAVGSQLYTSHPLNAPLQDRGGQVYNVKSYGAKGDGVTDDEPAIQNATNAAIAAGGGTVYLPRGKYYLQTTSALGYIAAQASHMHFLCDPGAQFLTQNSTQNTIFSLGYPATGIQTKAGFPANVINYIGSSTITLTTATDTSNFAVGDPIYILGAPSHESNGDGEINFITAINTSTGVLTLQKPTSKVYTGNNSNVGTPGIVTVIDGAGMFYTDESIEGCTALNIAGDFAFFGQILGGKMLRNTVTVNPTSARGMMINSYYPMADIEVAGNSYTSASNSALWQLADGFRDIYIHHNTLISPYGASILNPSQGIINLHISNNNMYITFVSTSTNNNAAIVFSTAYNVTIDHNHIFAANTYNQLGAVLLMGLSNGACTGCVVDSNLLVGNNVGVFSSSGAPNLIVTNNIMTGTSNHILVYAGGPNGIYTGNIIKAISPVNNLLYIVEVTGTQTIFSGNYIYTDTAVVNVDALAISIGAGNSMVANNNYIYGSNRGIHVYSGSPTILGNACDNVATFTAYCTVNLAGTAVLGTTAIANGACATAVTVAATGVTTADSIPWSFASAPSGTYLNGLVVSSYPTANNVNFMVCNPTAASLTPPAATLNWRVIR